MNKIIHGDFREYMHMIPGNAYIISDPPYNQNTTTGSMAMT